MVLEITEQLRLPNHTTWISLIKYFFAFIPLVHLVCISCFQKANSIFSIMNSYLLIPCNLYRRNGSYCTLQQCVHHHVIITHLFHTQVFSPQLSESSKIANMCWNKHVVQKRCHCPVGANQRCVVWTKSEKRIRILMNWKQHLKDR